MEDLKQRSNITLTTVLTDATAYEQFRRQMMPFIQNIVKRQHFSYRLKLDSQSLFAETLTQAFLLSKGSNAYQECGKLDRWLIKIAQLISKQYSKKIDRLGITRLPAHLTGTKAVLSIDNLEVTDGLMAKVFNFLEDEKRDAHTGLTSEQMDQLKLVKKQIAALPAIQANVIQLYYLKGSSIEDISETLDISPGNTRVLLYRARKSLRKYFME